MAKLVSNIYGDALFEVAAENGTIDSMLEEVEAVLDIFQENEEYVKLLNHPKIPVEEKISLLKGAFEGKISNEIMGLFSTVIEKGRFAEVESILSYFVSKVMEYKKIGTAYVTSAMPMSDEELANVEKRLLETTSYNEMHIVHDVDRNLIGGMTIRIGDRVLDSSIRTKLDSMAKELSQITLS